MNIFNDFEEFSQQQDAPANIKIQYLVLFRQWKKLFEQDISKDIDNPLYYPVLKEEKIEWKKHNTLTLKNCIDWNWGYIEKYLRKNNNALYEELRKSINGDNELCYYSDILEGGKDVYELFYCSMQPILDVDYIKAQEKAYENSKSLN